MRNYSLSFVTELTRRESRIKIVNFTNIFQALGYEIFRENVVHFPSPFIRTGGMAKLKNDDKNCLQLFLYGSNIYSNSNTILDDFE